MADVQPKPDLDDIPMKPAPAAETVDQEEEPTGERPTDVPAEDLTLPTD